MLRAGRGPGSLSLSAMQPHSRDGRSTRWDDHRRERRSTIIAAAITAIERQGPDVPIGEIAAVAHVPRTHIYRHFEDKPALDLAVARHVAAQIGERIRTGLAVSGSARDVISAAIGAHLAWVQQHPNLYRFLAQHAYAVNVTGSPAVDDAKAALAKELVTVLEGYMVALGLDTAPAERVIVGVVGLVDATAAWWLEHPEVRRSDLQAELTEQVWLILDHTSRQLGLVIDPAATLPTV
jgi:AcrR family transcriptional regulator